MTTEQTTQPAPLPNPETREGQEQMKAMGLIPFPVPDDLTPRLPFSDEQIRAGLPERGRFTLRDLRCYATMPR